MACANRLWHTLTDADRAVLASNMCLSTLLELDAYKAFVAKYRYTATALPSAVARDNGAASEVEEDEDEEDSSERGESS
jgi:hypothetical protein